MPKRVSLIRLVLLAVLFFGQSTFAGYVFNDLYSIGLNATPNSISRVQVGGSAVGQINGTLTHAVLWTITGSQVDLHPVGLPGIDGSALESSRGPQQVGYGYTTVNFSQITHALLWTGTAASAVDLNPTALGMTVSNAWATDGKGQQVGNAAVSGSLPLHAMLWSGTAASAVDLNPTQLVGSNGGSDAFGTDGMQQVGTSAKANASNSHATLWSGTAASAVNLDPGLSNLPNTIAAAVSGNQEVGVASNFTTGVQHAMLWTGTAASAVDLNGSLLTFSTAQDTNGIQQVGYGDFAGTQAHALLWSGTADSLVDLQSFLPTTPTSDPSKYFIASIANSIDSSGNVFGYAYDGNRDVHVVEWAVTPEPTMGVGLLVGFCAVARRYRFIRS